MLVFALALVALAHTGPCRAEIPLDQRRSGYDQMSPATKAMQDDDTSNPATLSVLDGEALWKRKAGAADKACADCHGDAATSMRGVSARYPAFSPAKGRPIDHRAAHQSLPHRAAEGAAARAREPRSARAHRVRRQAVARHAHRGHERREDRAVHRGGPRSYGTRQGQLNLSCQNCHDDHWGQKLAGVPLVQGHPNGYPLYRLEWQSVGSLQRRLRNCLIGMRAEPYAYGADEYVDLELFLMWRARGMTVETPAVRP